MIAIHDAPGSFSDRWIETCQAQGIPFTRINCLASDVVQQCANQEAVLWHWLFKNPREQLVARQIIAALEKAGLIVFPNAASCWHYDDKVGQKYLLEAIRAPLIRTWAFTNPDEAHAWIAQAAWPKVFKLRRGAGSVNVRLVRSRREAEMLCRHAFGRGHAAHGGYFCDARTRLERIDGWKTFWTKISRAPRSLWENYVAARQTPRERGYVYFQDFLPGNTFDTRVTVIGHRAFGYIRENRPGDFRASGSGRPIYDPVRVDSRCLAIAFEVSEQIGSQSLAFDFLVDQRSQPKISEVSYCYVDWMVRACPGYWDRALAWHEGQMWPQDAILEDVLASLSQDSARVPLFSEKSCQCADLRTCP